MEEYIQGVASIPGAEKMIRYYAPKMRSWDVASAQGVDQFVANSSFVKDRVQRFYNRNASVIHPPVHIAWYQKASHETQKGGYLLAAGAMVSYKRFDLAIHACERLGKRLILAGSGPMLPQLKKIAGSHCQFVIQPDDLTFAKLLAGADALIFPGVEDFGMIAIEAMAAGTPVIALKKGGALDFINDHETGLFFPEPTVESLTTCIKSFKANAFSRETLWNWALGFGKSSFLRKMKNEIDSLFG
jgi:glycosyltransferase involved in cell wall biosynthesis